MIRFGIVGCGRIAHRHAEHIKTNGHLVAVCDTDQDKADSFADKYGVKAFYSIDDMLKGSDQELDVIAVCTPNGWHAEHSIRALEAGKHVICEKPMALSSADCRKMIQVADLTGKHLIIVKQNRYNPPVVAVKTAIENGHLGRIFSVQLSCFWNRNAEYYRNSWKGTLGMDGGTLYTQFSHFIDMLNWMIGHISEVNSYMHNYAHKGIIEFEDTGVAIIRFNNGAIGTVNYTVNSYAKNMEGSLTIFGEKGTVKIGGQYLNVLEYQAIQDFKISGLPSGNPANNYGDYQGSMSNHEKVYENLINVLNNGASPTTSLQDGLKTVEIIEKIYQSAYIRTPMELATPKT